MSSQKGWKPWYIRVLAMTVKIYMLSYAVICFTVCRRREVGNCPRKRCPPVHLSSRGAVWNARAVRDEKRESLIPAPEKMDSFLWYIKGYRLPICFILGHFFLRRRAWRSHPTVRTECLVTGAGRRVDVVAGGTVVNHTAFTRSRRPCSAASSLVNTRLLRIFRLPMGVLSMQKSPS